MTQFYRYRNPIGATSTFSVDLANDVIRYGEIEGLEELAEHCSTGQSQIVLDDPDADLGHAGDAVGALGRFDIDETAMAAGSRRVYSGLTAERTYRRRPGSSLILDSSREIVCDLVDLNALVSLPIIPQSDRTAIRPAESVTVRLNWLLSTPYLAGVVADNGLVAISSAAMSAADYRGQRPVNVINDCEMAAEFNAFVYPDEAATVEPSLFFDDPNISTEYTSTLRLTNVLDDVDESTTFAVGMATTLRRDPTDVGSGVFLPFRNGAVYQTRQATRDYFGPKDLAAPNSNVRRRSNAQRIASSFLWQHSTEEDRITAAIELPSTHVNLIRAGHRLEVKFEHLPGYEAWTWTRVIRRTTTAITDERYRLVLELSPQEQPCAESVEPTFVQYLYVTDGVNSALTPQWTAEYTLDAPSTIGNLMVLGTRSPSDQGSYVVAAPAGWNWAVVNEPTDTAYNNVFWKISQGEQTVRVQYSDADGQQQILWIEYAGLSSPTLAVGPIVNIQDPGPGYGTVSATTYPSGPAAVVALCFMDDGPQGGPLHITETPGATMQYEIPGDLHGAGEIGFSEILRDGSAGTTPEFPSAGDTLGWRFLGTGNGPTITVSMVFVGENC